MPRDSRRPIQVWLRSIWETKCKPSASPQITLPIFPSRKGNELSKDLPGALAPCTLRVQLGPGFACQSLALVIPLALGCLRSNPKTPPMAKPGNCSLRPEAHGSVLCLARLHLAQRCVPWQEIALCQSGPSLGCDSVGAPGLKSDFPRFYESWM